VQAREYFQAAETVSIATKPNLMYYGTMSLALAEILLKQSGLSSLDKARSEHRHHGLTMSAGGIPRGASLTDAANHLRAIPLATNGTRRGTFELWHRSSREHPVAGDITTVFPTGRSTSTYGGILGAIDQPYPHVPAGGLTMTDCLLGLPLMVEHAAASGLETKFIRCRCDSRIQPGDQWRQDIRIMLHPSSLISELLESVSVNANSMHALEFAEVGGGLQIDIKSDWINGNTGLPLPPAATIDTNEWRLWTNSPPLNEFGYFYMALFLAGNYARYYPDKWLMDVEQSTPLGLAIEELCNIAEWRVPWLALCELDMNMYVNEA
jgi:hypothetical protein